MSAEPLRVLIIEDVPMDAELVQYELGRARIPFEARRVDTREDFLAELDAFAPDVILSDYTLPRFDGLAALELARSHAPAIPFLIVTGSINEETAVGAMKAGAADYLLKNNLARIGPAIEGALARVRARREKARAEDALRRSEANLRAVFNDGLQAFVLVNTEGIVQALNRTAERWSERFRGRRLAEGDHIFDFTPEAGAAVQAALAGEAGSVERCLRDPSGAEAWFETTHAPVVDDDGRIIGVSLNAREVSERKHAERALRESEARYRDLFDNASDLVCATDREGHFLYVNRAWHEGTGYSDTELAALRFGDLVHPESRARCAEVMERALAGETLTHVELTLMPRSAVPIVVEGNLSGARQADGSVTLRGIYRDITERKRVDEQLRRAERMQAAGRLAGGMAHEVNNMMTGVIGFAEFLLRGLAPDDPRRSEVQEIIRAGSRAADVTRQLLAFTRQQLMHPEVLAINDVVVGLEKMLRHSLGENHELDLRLDGGLREIRADRGQLEQVLINLILNARDALPASGRVTIATAPAQLDEVYTSRRGDVEMAPGAYVLLSVSDTGCGMEPEVQARIFEPFFTTKPVGQGTGLGLSTVYGIVKQSGGFIWCYSEPGLGSTFKVYLPALLAGTAEPTRVPRPAAPRGGSETVLVVEDEDVVRAMACRGLREHGYTVLEARNGAEALAVVQENTAAIDLVVSDVVMPLVGGRELAARLAELDPALPVLYMSGYTGEDVVQRGLMDPGAPFAQKPFTPDGLARTVRELLDARIGRRTASAS
jgi:two-component system cell cycle sensor histidine kinase/response regulator CckA